MSKASCSQESTSSQLALVECVARALLIAIDDPQTHSQRSSAAASSPLGPRKRQRPCAEDQATSMRALSVFDSSEIPGIGVDRYLMRLKSVFRCSDAVFVAALVLLDRFLGGCGPPDGAPQPLTMRNVHRLFLASLVVATKYNEDMVYGNAHYAKAGGVHIREVNRLERCLLAALDYDLHVFPEQYQQYEKMLKTLRDEPKASEALRVVDTKDSRACRSSPAASPSAGGPPSGPGHGRGYGREHPGGGELRPGADQPHNFGPQKPAKPKPQVPAPVDMASGAGRGAHPRPHGRVPT